MNLWIMLYARRSDTRSPVALPIIIYEYVAESRQNENSDLKCNSFSSLFSLGEKLRRTLKNILTEWRASMKHVSLDVV